jgi:16S rRNA (guanine966-N2)-methyltransferase
MINIIGGSKKGSKLIVSENDVRPTSAIKREAIFSILESYALKNSFNLYKNKCVVDLFAGSGSLGLEAVSRGASFGYFFELNSEVNKSLEINCKKICKLNQYDILQQDVNSIINIDITYPLSIIFIDPPYKLDPFEDLLNLFLKIDIINKETIIVIESDKKTVVHLVKDWTIIKEKIYGKTKITFLKKVRINIV